MNYTFSHKLSYIFSYSVHQIIKRQYPQQYSPTESNASKDILPSSSNCELPEITIEDIKDNYDELLFFIGFPDYGTYKPLFECPIQKAADKFVFDSSAMKTDGKKRGSEKEALNCEFYMVLI